MGTLRVGVSDMPNPSKPSGIRDRSENSEARIIVNKLKVVNLLKLVGLVKLASLLREASGNLKPDEA